MSWLLRRKYTCRNYFKAGRSEQNSTAAFLLFASHKATFFVTSIRNSLAVTSFFYLLHVEPITGGLN